MRTISHFCPIGLMYFFPFVEESYKGVAKCDTLFTHLSKILEEEDPRNDHTS